MKFFLAFCAILCCANSRHLPDYLPPYNCINSDPNFSKCLQKHLESLIPYAIKGIPELDIPPLDPLEVPSMTMVRNISNLVNIKAISTNMRTTGLRNLIIENLKFDPVKLNGEIRIHVPFIQTEMDYDVKGEALGSHLNNAGHFKGNFTDIKAVCKLSLVTVLRDGVEYFKVNKLTPKFDVGDFQVELAASDPTKQATAEFMTKFANENQRIILNTIHPYMLEGASDILRELIDRRLEMIPAKELLPNYGD